MISISLTYWVLPFIDCHLTSNNLSISDWNSHQKPQHNSASHHVSKALAYNRYHCLHQLQKDKILWQQKAPLPALSILRFYDSLYVCLRVACKHCRKDVILSWLYVSKWLLHTEFKLTDPMWVLINSTWKNH